MFTFKKDKKETGLAGVANPYPATTIKYKKREVGTIYPPSRYSADWSVGLRVKEKATAECSWGWVKFMARHKTEESAREWLNKNFKFITESYTLALPED